MHKNAIDRVTTANFRGLGRYCSNTDTHLPVPVPVLTAFTESVDSVLSATNLRHCPRKPVTLVEE